MKNSMPYMVRQGDVMLVKVAAIPKDAKPKERDGGRCVLAYGEVTGHAHAIADVGALLLDHGEELFLRADGVVTLRHEEHAPIEIPKGRYRVVRQREYHPAEIRQVRD